jgi:hypothetical protein
MIELRSSREILQRYLTYLFAVRLLPCDSLKVHLMKSSTVYVGKVELMCTVVIVLKAGKDQESTAAHVSYRLKATKTSKKVVVSSN